MAHSADGRELPSETANGIGEGVWVVEVREMSCPRDQLDASVGMCAGEVRLEQGPAAHGWVEDQVWTAARVATLIGRKFHVSYSASGATRLMHRRGFSPQVPARRVAERDEQAVTAWKERPGPR
jgi:hypothetical protein